MPKYISLADRLSKLSFSQPSVFGTSSPCSTWSGYTQKDGYVSLSEGYGRINLMRDGRSLKFPTHRVAKVLEEIEMLVEAFDFYSQKDRALFFDLYDAYSALRLSIDHLCKNSLCINPNHLEWVHMAANLQRKKWSSRKLASRFKVVASKKTRHHRTLARSSTVHEFIRRIQNKGYRKK